MISLKNLEKIYIVDKNINSTFLDLPSDLNKFYQICNGIMGDIEGETSLTIYPKQFLEVRNNDYEIPEYLPNFIMIGDDGGGIAILMKKSDQIIYASGMGTLDEISTIEIASNLETFLITNKGSLENYY